MIFAVQFWTYVKILYIIQLLLFPRDETGVLEQVSGTSVTSLVHDQIQKHVETTCKGNFETAYLDTLENVSTCGITRSGLYSPAIVKNVIILILQSFLYLTHYLMCQF